MGHMSSTAPNRFSPNIFRPLSTGERDKYTENRPYQQQKTLVLTPEDLLRANFPRAALVATLHRNGIRSRPCALPFDKAMLILPFKRLILCSKTDDTSVAMLIYANKPAFSRRWGIEAFQ
jgi:hypothetical protein